MTFTFNIQQKVNRFTAKQQHRLFQMTKLPIDLRRYVHFTAQSLKFEELEKREKNPIRREYYHRLNILKYQRAMMYSKRYHDKHYRGEIGIPRPNTGEMVVAEEQTTELAQVFDNRPTTHIGEISVDSIKQQIEEL